MRKTRAMLKPVGLSLLGLTAFLAVGAAAQQAGDGVLFEGAWTNGGYSIAGGWSIVQENESRYVVLDEDFKTRRAPDLKIFLSPLPLADLGDDNATSGSVLVAPLESHDGPHSYMIGADVDLGSYRSILIHCQQYSKYWGGAELTAVE